jgi:hypothetical protein
MYHYISTQCSLEALEEITHRKSLNCLDEAQINIQNCRDYLDKKKWVSHRTYL